MGECLDEEPFVVPDDRAAGTLGVGTVVCDGAGQSYEYGGPLDRPGYRIRYTLSGSDSIYCDPLKVMPTAAHPIHLDVKDARITVAEDPFGRPARSIAGVWRAQVPGDETPYWHKTKGAAVEQAARRLAIADWWAGHTTRNGEFDGDTGTVCRCGEGYSTGNSPLCGSCETDLWINQHICEEDCPC